MAASNTIMFALAPEEVQDFVGVIAELGIAVHETKVIEQTADRKARLGRVEELVASWSRVVQLRGQLARAEAELKREST